MTLAQTWGQRIKARREELGISAEELGGRIDRTFQTVYRYENGQITPTPEVMVDLAKALDVSPCRLFFPDQCTEAE